MINSNPLKKGEQKSTKHFEAFNKKREAKSKIDNDLSQLLSDIKTHGDISLIISDHVNRKNP